jgi:predicted glycoside hydrolase/deacetylase ChbG (UPF0249 family)
LELSIPMPTLPPPPGPPRRRRLIVTADDYGLAPGVDEGIRRAVRAGVVTAVSILIERVDADAIARLVDHGDPALGLHVDCTDDQLHDAAGDARERFHRQLDRFVTLVGASPIHLDSHKHTHVRHPHLLREMTATGLPIRADSRRLRRCLIRRGIPCADTFVGGAGRRPFWTSERLRAAIRCVPLGLTEWMVHPGTADGLPPAVRYRGQRAVELTALTAPDLPLLLRSHGIELSDWRHCRADAPLRRPNLPEEQ